MDILKQDVTFLSGDSHVSGRRPRAIGRVGLELQRRARLHLAAHDPRVKTVVSQVPATDITREVKELLDPGAFELIRSMITEERARRATEGGEVYVVNAALPDYEGFALQRDKESYEFGAGTPTWPNEITLSFARACSRVPTALSVELISPRPLLMILAEDDVHAPADWVRDVFDRAGEPKKLLEVAGGHYAVYVGPGADQDTTAAAQWFSDHLRAPVAAT